MRILLGALVTQMAGSVGGQTIRRSQNGQIFYNKSLKRNTNSLGLSSQVRRLQNIMTSWKNLPNNKYMAVVDNSTRDVFTDKFGNPIYLKPYNYYVAVMSKLALIPTASPDSLLTPSTLPLIDMQIEAIDISSGSVIFYASNQAYDDYFILRIYINNNSRITPSVKLSKIIYGGNLDEYSAKNVYDTLIAFYPRLQAGDTATIYTQAIARNGYSGAILFTQQLLVID